jgi:iron complex outermembrane receptor protein
MLHQVPRKGDYLKLRSLTAVTFGNKGKYIKNLSAFITGSNLFVITKFTGFDPEVNIDKSNNSYPSRSIEYVPYPTPRAISFGFNFTL